MHTTHVAFDIQLRKATSTPPANSASNYATNLKIRQDANQLSVGFFGRVARMARVHQEGLSDRVSKKGPEYQYPARGLLGFSAADRELIRDSLLRHLTP